MKNFIALMILSVFFLSCENEIKLLQKDGWLDGYNIAAMDCPIKNFKINDQSENIGKYNIEPGNIVISLNKQSFKDDTGLFSYELFLDGKKVKEFTNIDQNLILDYEIDLKNLQLLETYNITISDVKLSKCSLKKSFSLVCANGQIYTNNTCASCPGKKTNNGNNVCACTNGAINDQCNQCPSGLSYFISTDSCGTCAQDQIYQNQTCVDCPGRKRNNGNNVCACTNGAINDQCNQCPSGLSYFISTDSCGTCAQNQIYLNQTCVNCPGKKVNNGSNICACANGAINDQCNQCPSHLNYMKNTDSCGTCANNQIYQNQACVTCPGNQVNIGNNFCGCTNGATNTDCYIYANKIDQFTQNEDNNKVDIIWVVDNSGSMFNEQTLLSQNFESFINSFVTNSLSYKMGITTTDTRAPSTGQGGHFQGAIPVLHSSMSGNYIKDNFMTNVMVGTKGSGIEKGLLAAEMALENNFISSSPNYGFLRADAFLAIIIVSDENDSSPDSVQTHINKIRSFKNKANNSAILSIVDTKSTSKTFYGERYIDASNLTGGFVEDINSNFAGALQRIGSDIVFLVKSFRLSHTPVVSSIIVRVNGVIIVKSVSSGWSYDAPSVSINFSGSYVPPSGASISISYQYIVN